MKCVTKVMITLALGYSLPALSMKREDPVGKQRTPQLSEHISFDDFDLHLDEEAVILDDIKLDEKFKGLAMNEAFKEEHAKSNSVQQELINAARNARADIIPDLIIKGAKIEARDSDGKTPLIHAVQSACVGRLLPIDYTDTIKLLFIYEARPDNVDNSGITALRYAALAGKADIVRLLLDNRAKLDERSKKSLALYGITNF